MLTEHDLLKLKYIPELDDISFELYNHFYQNYLSKITFRYHLLNGQTIDLKFQSYSIPHMLAMHKYDSVNKNKDFYQLVLNNTISINYYLQHPVKSVRDNFRKYRKRICAFACVYTILRNGSMFYLPDNYIQGKIKADYEWFEIISEKGITIGTRECMEEPGIQAPITILVAGKDNPQKHIANGSIVYVEKLEIFNTCDLSNTNPFPIDIVYH